MLISIGFMYCSDVGLILITWPPNLAVKAEYSDSGSEIIMSSSVTRKLFAISLLAENDFPEPGVPRISAFGFLSFFLSTIIMLFERALSP